MTQADLVVRAQHGDADAYSQLTSSAAPRLYRAAWLILRDDDRAADAVQDALLSGWVDLRSLRDADRFDAWMYRVLVRTCYASARHHRRRSAAENTVSWADAPSTIDDQQHYALRDQIDRAFNRLSAEHRTVIVLVHYVGLSLSETATVIGVPIGTVQSRLSRAMQSMRGAIEADDRLSQQVQVSTR